MAATYSGDRQLPDGHPYLRAALRAAAAGMAKPHMAEIRTQLVPPHACAFDLYTGATEIVGIQATAAMGTRGERDALQPRTQKR